MRSLNILPSMGGNVFLLKRTRIVTTLVGIFAYCTGISLRSMSVTEIDAAYGSAIEVDLKFHHYPNKIYLPRGLVLHS